MSIIKDALIKAHLVDPELSKVRADEKRQDILNVLHSVDASHYERLWMVGFLRFVGYDEVDILDIIHKGTSWADYDPKMTQRQVTSIFRRNAKRDIQDAVKGGYDGLVTVLSQRKIVDYEPIDCQVGRTRVVCYFKNCEKCPLKHGVAE